MMFGIWTNTQTWYGGGRVRVYYLKIYNNSSLIMDLIPVKAGTTGYMFDKISKTLYGNNSTGNFILGPGLTYN